MRVEINRNERIPFVVLGASIYMSHSMNSVANNLQIADVLEYKMSLVQDDFAHTPLSLSKIELDELMDSNVKHILDVLDGGVFSMSETGYIRSYSHAFYKRFGVEQDTFNLQAWLELVHPLDRPKLQQKIDFHFSGNERKHKTQYRVRTTEGHYIWVTGTAVIKEINGKRILIGCHKDISDLKLNDIDPSYSSTQQELFWLGNEQKLKMDVENHSREREYFSLFYVQITNIRSYLSLYGPNILRDLLKHLRVALSSLPEQTYDVYQIRSDDFAILINGDLPQNEIIQLGRKITRKFNDSIETNEILYGTEICVGIYPNFPLKRGMDEAIQIASRTSQFASEQESNKLSVYEGSTKTKVDRHCYVERELGNAIMQQILSVKFQPIVCAQKNKLASFEALVRWRSPEFGEIYPDEFISVAERKGLIVDLGYVVFTKACQFLQQYQETHQNDVRVNINVSVIQLLNQSFPDTVKALADQYQTPTKNIVLELTETLILDGNKKAVKQLNRLKDYGFQLSLDDFGAGYTSLNSFFDLPLQQIKIDRSVAQRSMTNPATFEYLSFITQLCRTYNVDIVIEGIEDAKMQKMFTDMGASYLQGYWFSKPLSIASASYYTAV